MQNVANSNMAQHSMAADPFLVDNTARLQNDITRAPHHVTRISGFADSTAHHPAGHYDTSAPPGLSQPTTYSHQQGSQPSYRLSVALNSKDSGAPSGLALSSVSGSPKKSGSSGANHQNRHSLGKASHVPFLNLASLKSYSAWSGSPVNPPTPLAVPPTPLSHPSAQAQSTPTNGGQKGSNKFLGGLKLVRSDGSSKSAHTQAPIVHSSSKTGTLHPFALPANEPQQYICYNLDASKDSPGTKCSPLSPPPTPSGHAVPQRTSQTPNGGSSMVLCTPPASKPVPASAQLPPKAEKPGAIPTCAKFLADGRLNAAFEQQYEILDELGSGGFGFVIRARRREDGLIVAVKFIFRERVSAAHLVSCIVCMRVLTSVSYFHRFPHTVGSEPAVGLRLSMVSLVPRDSFHSKPMYFASSDTPVSSPSWISSKMRQFCISSWSTTVHLGNHLLLRQLLLLLLLSKQSPNQTEILI